MVATPLILDINFFYPTNLRPLQFIQSILYKNPPLLMKF